MKLRMLIFLGCLLQSLPGFANEPLLRTADKATYIQTLQPLLDSVNARIPFLVRGALSSYNVIYSDLGTVSDDLCAENLKPAKWVHFSKSTIYLHYRLHNLMKSGASCELSGQSAQAFAEQVLLYQIAKLYDLSSYHWQNPWDKSYLETCHSKFAQGDQPLNSQSDDLCFYYLRNAYKVSATANYRHLTDFGSLFSSNKNTRSKTLSNTEELSSPQESFALNFMQFFSEPSFQCRRPALQAFFMDLTQSRPFPSSACHPLTSILTSTALWKIDIAPEKVYQVHFLFAGSGDELMSRWGHSMLRLIVCAPYRKTVGPDCLKDISYHVVLSYRGNVNDVITSYWDGITGEYPSQLLAFSMPEIIDEYTRGEWRDLISLPLNLNTKEQNLFVQSVLEHYWNYVGDYKFFSNNCASETDNLIRGVLPKTHPFQELKTLTPLGLYQNLAQAGLMDPSLITDRLSAEKKGLFLPSSKSSLEQSYQKIQGHFPQYSDLAQWSQYSSALERREVYSQFQSLEAIGAAYSLEKYIELQKYRKLKGALAKAANENAQGALSDPHILKNFLHANEKRSPWLIAERNSGVPLASELLEENKLTSLREENKALYTSYKNQISEVQPELQQEIYAIKDNLKLLANLKEVLK
ncbi:MAG: DUF4105 domain-containing protein [Bdellovibrio sp.]